MPGYFITGTGTDIGKTLVTAGLCWQLGSSGRQVRAVKPVVTGIDDKNWQESDPATLLRAMGQEVKDAMVLKQVSPWRFAQPVSPHLAARHAGVELTVDEIAAWCFSSIAADDSMTLVEGAGGLMTPINEQETMLDLAVTLGLPTILVMGSYVGALSHALCAVTAMNTRGVNVQAIMVNESTNSQTTLEETCTTMQGFLGLNLPVLSIPRILPGSRIWQQLPSLTKALD